MVPTCQHCGEPLALLARRHARYCSGRCRVAAHRRRHADPVPVDLRSVPRWVCHTARKVPVQPSGRAASSTDPSTWTTYEAARDGGRPGIGFVLAGDGIVCLDLDHCLDGDRLEPWAERILALAPGTYVEVSPSGTGLHVWGRGRVERGRRTPHGEVYGTGRYITVTGRPFRGAPSVLADVSAAVESV